MSAAPDYSDTLNELIETCIDGQHGFETAAEAMDNPQLRSELMRYSQQRAEFAQELQRLVEASGDEPRHRGSIAGDLHRGWMNLSQAATTSDTKAILAECERGEDSAVETYREALNEPLPLPLAVEVASQYQAIQEAHDRVRDLAQRADA